MEMKDHWSNQSTDPEISSPPAASAATTKEEPDITKNSAKMLLKEDKENKNSKAEQSL